MADNSLIGQTLRQRYKIVAKLGKGGGFGETYLASDLDIPEIPKPRRVVKRLKPTMQHPEVERLFQLEAETLNKLGKHDRIPTLYAYFQEDGEFYLVQELIEGRDLGGEMKRRWKETEAHAFLEEILEILAFVHNSGVIHRDLKPANIMRRDRDRQLVLIDFGAVKEVSNTIFDGRGIASKTIGIGTPGYIPCEQAQGRPKFCSDIYAAGTIAIQALTGIVPTQIPESDRGELDWQKYAPNLSERLTDILTKMVRFRCHERYANATVALVALRRGDSEPIAALKGQQDRAIPGTISSQQKIDLPFTPQRQEATIYQNGERIETSLPLETPSAQVPIYSNFYIERPPIESECYQTIMNPGALIRVKAPRQMGKTSLVTRILERSRKQGDRTVFLNLQLADSESLETLDGFLQWFCAIISDELGLEEKVAEYWGGVLNSKRKCTKYFSLYLLSEISNPLVLGLDEVDKIFQHPKIATDFFALLRAWHEQGRSDGVWQKLRLVIAHSQEVYIPLNINQSPFNVGLPIALREFSTAEVEDLVLKHELNWSEERVKQLMKTIGGHPYLVRVALYQIVGRKMSLEELLEVAPTEEGPYADHLRRHLYNLEENQEILTAIKEVIAADSPVQIGAKEGFKLHSMGLVKFQGNLVAPLCELYRLYFSDRLLN